MGTLSKTIRTTGIVFAAAAIAAALSPQPAVAAYKPTLTREYGIDYSNHMTGFYKADGEVAYCVQPASGMAGLHSYPATKLTNKHMQAILYYGYGGPGFSIAKKNGIWPSKYYGGAKWSSDQYYAMTHVILSYAYGSNPYTGMSTKFKNWSKNTLIEGGKSTYKKMIAAYGDVPQWFRDSCYIFNRGTSSQDMVTFKSQNAGGIHITKKEYGTNRNMAGAKFTIYNSNASRTKGAKVNHPPLDLTVLKRGLGGEETL